jgi:hypothetical protein
MTLPENGKPLWDESRVESLLKEFYQREMPAPLRHPNPARLQRSQLPVPSASNWDANSRANSKTGGLMVGFTFILLVMMVVIVWNPPFEAPPDPGSNTGHRSSETSNSQVKDPEGGPSDPFKSNRQEPVEMRPRTHAVGMEDSENPPFPELDVEVFPLDGEAPIAPKSRKPAADDPPMPKERRALPENQPGPDPDEAQTPSLLPELPVVFPAAGNE